jgi:pyruvate dehydrogenase (quinone)
LLGTDFAWSQFYPDKAKIIQIDADSTHIGRRHPVTVGVVGDIKPTLEALLPRLEQHQDDSFLATYAERHRKSRAAAKAETVSGPEATIPGTYLTQIINRHAPEDALFAADDGTALVWTLRHIDSGGKRRTFGSLLHGTMAGGMPSALGLQKAQPGRQVICLAGDGGFSMLLGDLMTAVQEKLPIKIVVYNNGKLGFIDIEQKSVGLVPVFTDLQNPNFGDVAKAMGLWGRMVVKAGELEEAVGEWLAQPGPAVLDVKVNPMELVMPPSPFVSPEAVVGMGV